jgi:predicted dienelactone hydrolase
MNRFSILLVLVGIVTAGEPWSGTIPEHAAARNTDAVVTTTDDVRLELVVHHPADGTGPWPVVIFSHGLGGSCTGYGFLGQYWAAHGYVSIHLTHPGSDTSLLARPLAQIPTAMRAATIDPAILLGRPRQVAVVIAALSEIERQIPALAGRLDRERIAVAGHSFGAYTTMMVAGAKIDLPGKPDTVVSDPRPRCFLTLSPQGTGPAFDRQAWDGITRPVLMMTGSLDEQPKAVSWGDTHQGGEWRSEPFRLMAPGDKWLVWIDGARHSTFSGGAGAQLSGELKPDPQHFAWVQAMSLAFFDAYLRDDASARRWLAEDAAPLYAPAVRVEQR